MDTNEKLRIELIKRLRKFSEDYIPNYLHKNSKNSNSKDHKKYSGQKNDLSKRHKSKFSCGQKKIILNNNINSSKYNHLINHKSDQYVNNFYRKNKLDKITRFKSQDKQIKINLVSQKFKIADDFNEKNSNQFLYEKDECLREIFLTDEIEEEESTPFGAENKNENILELSSIKQNETFGSLKNKQSKRKKYKDDSIEFLSELIENIN